MKINDLLLPYHAESLKAPALDVNPLVEQDALQEAQVLDIRFDALAGVAGVLLELRQALQFRDVNTGMLVVRGVRQLAWSSPERESALTAWSIGSSVPEVQGRLLSLSLVMWPHPGAQLTLVAGNAAFYAGHVPGLAEAPPDYAEIEPPAMRSEVASWDSSFELAGAGSVGNFV